MRVLIITPKATGIGGVARHVSALASRLRRSNIEVDVVSTENTPHLAVKGLYNPSFALTSTFKGFSLRLHGEKYDIVHGHNLPTWPGVKAAPGEAKVLTLHGVYSESIRILYGSLAGRLAEKLEVWMLKRVDAVTCVAPHVSDYYQERGIRAYFIPNGLDFEELPSEAERLYEKQVIYAGRLSYEKGFDTLLEAAKHVEPDIQLVVVGSGLKELEEKARRLSSSLPNFHYLGFKEHAETLKLIAGSDALVLPSRSEGLSTVMLEAMALKVPVIATRIPGTTSIVSESHAVLVEPENPEQLARTINHTVKNPPLHLLDNAYRLVKEKFDWNIIADQYLKLYQELLQETPRSPSI